MFAIFAVMLFAANAVYGAAVPAPAVVPAPGVVPAPALVPSARYVTAPASVPYVAAPIQFAQYARAIPQNIPPYASSVNYFGRSPLLPYVTKSAVISPYVETLPAPLVAKVASPYVAAPYVTAPVAPQYVAAPVAPQYVAAPVPVAASPYVAAPSPFVPAVV